MRTAPIAVDPSRDRRHMTHALRLARRAGARGEVPVGALAVLGETVVAAAGNRVEASQDATQHAEMVVLRRAAGRLGSWRLLEVTLYATLEPCPMCAGAAVLARVGRVVYGAHDPRWGGVLSVLPVLTDPRGNHRPPVTAGVLADPCAQLLRQFFAARRAPAAPG
ncbi:MAG TPA: tRNA adenosine(34) deaminase TadA [Verrucomicrobiae bacterium]|nr:tRNA adenosine(34) deaminase TadA [Verrucomicrobiae bacterium]